MARALAYHERSKHRLPDHHAASLGYLDWASQPSPFRLYAGAEKLGLERPEPTLAGTFEPPLDAVYEPARLAARPLDVGSLSQLLYDALALSAWKEHGESRWSLRCNPSSGNLHPTEAYVVAGPVAGLATEPGLYHYTPLLHALERRRRLAPGVWEALGLRAGGFAVALGSIHWREAWKYGERAYRYCQHDVGHAVAALAFAAGALGWEVRRVPSVDDAALAALLGIDGQGGPEAEHPDGLFVVGPATAPGERAPAPLPAGLPPELLADLAGASLEGEPNRLSEEHHDWPAIDEVARACRQVGPERTALPPEPPACAPGADELTPRPEVAARRIFRTRRSAVAMSPERALPAADFFRMLERTLPCAGRVPFAALGGAPRVHLALFVHRVTGLGLVPGLYFLPRSAGARLRCVAALDAGFEWLRVDTGRLALPLYRLERGDTRRAARTIACGQAIASDGAFAVGMLAELPRALDEGGAVAYRRLHWEAGAIGQVLYLEAEAAGVRGTGIGCFFDDALGELCGYAGPELQTLYWFTVGGPTGDARLRTLDAYHHLAP
ncbi:MAG: nitroreductase family protein [Myxococcales bacterium]|nr:nitroreductase family protein [Myxococcales bacterium]